MPQNASDNFDVETVEQLRRRAAAHRDIPWAGPATPTVALRKQVAEVTGHKTSTCCLVRLHICGTHRQLTRSRVPVLQCEIWRGFRRLCFSYLAELSVVLQLAPAELQASSPCVRKWQPLMQYPTST